MDEKDIIDAKNVDLYNNKEYIELTKNANKFIDSYMHSEIEKRNFEYYSSRMLERTLADMQWTSIFTSSWRSVWSIFILIAISLCEVIMIAVIILKVIFKDFDTAFAITAVTTLLVQIVGLATIVFKFLFNKIDNKDADTYLELLKLLSQHEQKNS